jgi:hypothetical protein
MARLLVGRQTHVQEMLPILLLEHPRRSTRAETEACA